MSFQVIADFEKEIANFFGSPYAVAVDCCTHSLELCLRYSDVKSISVPKQTYISVPFLAEKIGIQLEWRDEDWHNYYYVTENIIDAAVLWKENSYIPGTLMCISFQFRKHLSLGRGGAILLDNEDIALELKKMSYDGRTPTTPWREQNISSMGYHYYMTPETAEMGLKKLSEAKRSKPRHWSASDYPDLTQMKVFKEQ